MIEEFIQQLNLIYQYLPGGFIVPLIGGSIGFLIGATIYVRSFKYLFCYYIEHGEVLCFIDNYEDRIKEVKKKHNLNKSFTPVGYVSGITWTVLKTALGVGIGSLWPLAVLVGIFTIPNFLIRYIAREQRNKVIFVNDLKGKK